mmetsp:Transcript_52584/g.118078  ORF Transcript_52584/g.118078 Transcript_52584/m.118078 type:complete len:135 (-) Transcript_52584:147-551(-)
MGQMADGKAPTHMERGVRDWDWVTTRATSQPLAVELTSSSTLWADLQLDTPIVPSALKRQIGRDGAGRAKPDGRHVASGPVGHEPPLDSVCPTSAQRLSPRLGLICVALDDNVEAGVLPQGLNHLLEKRLASCR